MDTKNTSKNNIVINADTVSDIYFAFDHFFPDGVVYSADKPYTQGNFYWNNKKEFIDYVQEKTGIVIQGNDKSAIKKAQEKFFEIAEGKIETEIVDTEMKGAPDAPVDANTLSPDKLKQLEIENEARENKRQEALQVAEAKQRSFEERLEKTKAKIWARKTKDIKEIKITSSNKEFIYNMAQAAKLDAGTTQEHVENLIRSSIPETEIENYPENLIRNRAANFVRTVQNFSEYTSPTEIPDTFVVTPAYSPLTSLINPNDQKLVDTFTDRFVRETVSSDAQQTILMLSAQRDLDAEIFEPAVFGGDKNLTAVFFGDDEILEFKPNGIEGDGVEITTSDLESLHQNSVEISKFFKKYIEIDSGGAEVISTGFTPLRIPQSEIRSIDTSKVIGKKSILGGIEGEETQGALARRIAREKAKLLAKVDSFIPSADPQIVSQTKSILSKISGEVIPKTIIKSSTLNPIRLSLSIGDGIRPISMELSGNFGGSTQSFLKLMRDTNTPLILTSIAIGSYATSDLAITSAIASQFNGKVLAYLGAGKYSFSVVNAGNTIIGGQALSYNTIRLQLGKKFFELGFTQTAGKIAYSTKLGITQTASKITSVALTKGVGAGVATKTVLPAFVAKIATFLGLAGSWATFGLSTVVGLGLGKFIEWIGPKLKKLFNENKEVFLIGGLGGMYLAGGGLLTALFVIPTLIGAAGVFTGGFMAMRAFRTIRNFVSAIFYMSVGNILMPILIFLLATPVVIVLILFIINSGAYIVPPSPLTIENIASPYIGIEKTADPSGPFENTDLPLKIKYTVTITSKKETLSNIQITNECQVYLESGSQKCQAPPIVRNEPISGGSSFTTTYEVIYNTTYKDAIVIDTINVTADTENSGLQSSSGSASITIGDPPSDCLIIDGNWPSGYKSNMQSAIGILASKYNNYVSKVCSAFPNGLLLKYNPSGYGNYWGWNHGQYIDFYQLGVKNPADALYTLSHELGHSLAWHVKGIQTSYESFPGITSEAPYCFYRDTINFDPSESLEEAIAFHIIQPRCGSVQQKYPLHYQFIMKYVFN